MFGNKPAGIEYAGVAGISRECRDAVMRYIQFGDKIKKVRILTGGRGHCLLLKINTGDTVAIKSGFGSGYNGEGPRTFSYILMLLDAHCDDIEEIEVGSALQKRLDKSALTSSDIEFLSTAKVVGPLRWYDYIWEKHFDMREEGTLWEEFHPVVPFSIMDSRIMDLAISFWDNPDDKLLTGYRRLEDIMRERTGFKGNGPKVFSEAFLSPQAKLTWSGLDEGELKSRANLFSAAYGAYRNRRAHSEMKTHSKEMLTEFLLLNHLYTLEKAAEEKGATATAVQ
jgi:hypothetical protein